MKKVVVLIDYQWISSPDRSLNAYDECKWFHHLLTMQITNAIQLEFQTFALEKSRIQSSSFYEPFYNLCDIHEHHISTEDTDSVESVLYALSSCLGFLANKYDNACFFTFSEYDEIDVVNAFQSEFSESKNNQFFQVSSFKQIAEKLNALFYKIDEIETEDDEQSSERLEDSCESSSDSETQQEVAEEVKKQDETVSSVCLLKINESWTFRLDWSWMYERFKYCQDNPFNSFERMDQKDARIIRDDLKAVRKKSLVREVAKDLNMLVRNSQNTEFVLSADDYIDYAEKTLKHFESLEKLRIQTIEYKTLTNHQMQAEFVSIIEP